MCLALRHVHSKHVIHRDIKGGNIFINNNEGTLECLMGDFGVGKVMQGTLAAANTIIGSPYFMSPEINSGILYTSQTDIWSLGCVLYEMCKLERVFDAKIIKKLNF